MQEHHKRTLDSIGNLEGRSKTYQEAPYAAPRGWDNRKVFTLQEFCDMLDEVRDSMIRSFENNPLIEKEIHIQTDGYGAGNLYISGWKKLTDAEYSAKLRRREASRKGNKAKRDRAKREAEETLKKIAKGHPDLMAKALASMVED